jgi:hypothetical protein
MKRQWLLIVSGARADVLAQCESERIKFESLGWAILITSGMATISMWFALYSAMGVNPIAATPLALLWGLVIMGIDRWLITSLPMEGRRRFSMAVPRLVLALLLGTLISTPLVLRIFQSEINAQISIMKATAASNFIQQQEKNQVGQQVTYWQGVVTSLEKVIDSGGVATINPANDPDVQTLTKQQATVYQHEQDYYKQWNCQLYGGPGCPAGAGNLYAAAHSQYEQAAAQYKQLGTEIQQREQALSAGDTASQESRLTQAKGQLPNAQQQLAVAQARQNELQANFDATNENEDGLLIRLQALSQLSNHNLTVAAARFLLFLLFLVIECLPVTVKLLQQPGNYEKILQLQRERELGDARRAFRGQRREPSGDQGHGAGSNTDDEVLQIWRARSQERTRAPHDDGQASGVQGYEDSPPPPSESAQKAPARGRPTGEQPSIADWDIRKIGDRDGRVSANSDGHGNGIPLDWGDDD